MLKFLFNLAVVVIVGYIIYIKFFKKPKQTIEQDKEEFKQVDNSIMVSCDKCGTFATTGDSIAKDGKFYCSKECAGVK